MANTDQYCILLPAKTPLFIHVYHALDRLQRFLPQDLRGKVHAEVFTKDGQPNDAKIAQQIAQRGVYFERKIVLGGVCDPRQAAEADLEIQAGIVKRLGFYIVANATNRDSVLDKLTSVRKIYAHGGPIINQGGKPCYTSTAQALARCLVKHFNLRTAIIESCQYEQVSLKNTDLLVTCNLPLVLSLKKLGAVHAENLSDLFPEWSRLFLSGLAKSHLTPSQTVVFETVVGAIQKACRHLRFTCSNEQITRILKRHFQDEVSSKLLNQHGRFYNLEKRHIKSGVDIAQMVAQELVEARIIPSNLEVTRLGAHLIDALWDNERLASAVLYNHRQRLSILKPEAKKLATGSIRSDLGRKAREETVRLILQQDVADDDNIDVVILTGLDEELMAVKQHFPRARRISIKEGLIKNCWLSEISINFESGQINKRRILLISAADAGRIPSAILTMNVLDQWKPKVVILAGIAGGYNKNPDVENLQLGDILIVNNVVDYEGQKITPSEHKLREKLYPLSRPLIEVAKAIMTQKRWYKFIKEKPPTNNLAADHTPQCHFLDKGRSCLLCGDKVIAASKFLKPTKKRYSEAMGVEMESAGVAAAVSAVSGQTPKYVVLKAVSDYADKHKGNSSSKSWRKYAVASSAAFVSEVAKYPELLNL